MYNIPTQHQTSSVSFKDKLEFNCIGANISSNLCLADVDNDGDIEMVVCQWESKELKDNGEADVENSMGRLYVFKHRKPWRFAEYKGMVTCVGAGDVCNIGQNLIMVLCADSYCYLYDVHNTKSDQTNSEASSSRKDPAISMNVWHSERVPFNSKNVNIADLDGDGLNEILIGYSDRTARMFRWEPASSDSNDSLRGHFSFLCKWELSGQIGSISLHWTPKDGASIIASQPGGAYAVLKHKTSETDAKKYTCLEYYPLDSKNSRNLEAKSEIVGNIRRRKPSRPGEEGRAEDQNPFLAVCSIDGSILLLDDKGIIWALQVERELFGMCRVDITNDAAEEVVVCCWDGMTYIVNHHKEVVRFHPGYSCQAFIAGSYAVSPGKNQPVLVYNTFNNRLFVYYNISLAQIQCISVKHKLTQSVTDKFSKMGIDVSNPNQFRWAVRWLCYEAPKGDAL